MSGIYIPGMEIPKEAGIYRIEFDQCGNPYLLSENGDLGLWHIISVPDHGRLGDLDKLEASFLKFLDKQNDDWMKTPTGMAERAMRVADWRIIKAAPTIIPADPIKEESE